MKMDMEKFDEDGWDDEDFVTKPRKKKSPVRRTNVDYRPLIIVGASVLAVIILLVSAGRGWQRMVDKKEITRLNESIADLQTKLQDLQKDNDDLESQIASLSIKSNNNTGDVKTEGGTLHQLQTAYNFREEASVDSDVLAELDEGTTVTIVKVLDDGWVQAKYNDQTGYLKCADELTGTTTSGTTAGTSGAANASTPEENENA